MTWRKQIVEWHRKPNFNLLQLDHTATPTVELERTLQTKLTSMDVIFKEGMLYLQGVKFGKVSLMEMLIILDKSAYCGLCYFC